MEAFNKGENRETDQYFQSKALYILSFIYAGGYNILKMLIYASVVYSYILRKV